MGANSRAVLQPVQLLHGQTNLGWQRDMDASADDGDERGNPTAVVSLSQVSGDVDPAFLQRVLEFNATDPRTHWKKSPPKKAAGGARAAAGAGTRKAPPKRRKRARTSSEDETSEPETSPQLTSDEE